MSSEIKNELQNYLESKNINALFVDIVEKILVDKPDNVISFITSHLISKYPDETAHLFEKKDRPPQLVVATEDAQNELHSDTSSANTNESIMSVEEEEKEPSVVRQRRGSVCAEKITVSYKLAFLFIIMHSIFISL